MNIEFAWDAYPDPTFEGYHIHVTPQSPTSWSVLATINGIGTTTATVTAPGYGPFRYCISAFKGTEDSPGSSVVDVDFPVAAPTGFRRVV